MRLSERVPIHGGHPYCECNNCHETLLISWSVWKSLQDKYGDDIRVVMPGHAWSGARVFTSTSLYDIIKPPVMI